MHIQNLVQFCPYVLQDIEWKRKSDINQRSILGKTTANNLNLDLVNTNAHTKFGKILSISSQDIEWKQNSDINQGP